MVRLAFFVGIFLVFASAQAAPLRIGVTDSILSLPLHVAKSEGFFVKRGVDVELVRCVFGHRCLTNMLNGQTELSISAELPAVLIGFTRNDFAILTSFVSVSSDVKVVSLRSAKITEPGKLKGKTLGYVKGSVSQYVLDLVLVYSGIDRAAVNLRAIEPEHALAAIANREVDALCLWEPFVSRIQLELGSQVQLVPIPKLYTETFNLMATHAVIKSRPKQLERIVLALKDSTNYIEANPDGAKALAVRHLSIPFSLINGIFDDYRYRLSLNRSLVRTMEGQARWALREGHVDRALPQPDFARLVYPDILKSIDPGAVSLH